MRPKIFDGRKLTYGNNSCFLNQSVTSLKELNYSNKVMCFNFVWNSYKFLKMRKKVCRKAFKWPEICKHNIIMILFHVWRNQLICPTPTLHLFQVYNKYPSAFVLVSSRWVLTSHVWPYKCPERTSNICTGESDCLICFLTSVPTPIDVNASLSGPAVMIKNSDSDFDFPSIKSRRHSPSLPWAVAGQAFECD